MLQKQSCPYVRLMLTRWLEVSLVSVVLFASTFGVVSPGRAYTPTGAIFDGGDAGQISPASRTDVRSLPPASTPTGPVVIPTHPTQASSSGQDESGVPASLASTNAGHDTAVTGAFTGLGYDGVTPPDGGVGAGPLNVMEMVNIQGEILTKGGVLINPPGVFSLNSFFGVPSSDFISDPKILFDGMSGAWFASVTDVTKSQVVLAVSKSNDATGTFCIYRVQDTVGHVADQPIIGLNNDKVIVSVNDFTSISFLGAKFWVINKGELTSCATASFVVFGPNIKYASIHPVQSETSTAVEFMVSTQGPTANTVALFSVTGVPPSTVTIKVTNLAVSAVTTPPAAVQRGTSSKLDTGDIRVQDADWSNNFLWLSHNNKCTPSGDTTARSCLHLVKINTGTSTPTVVQDFNWGMSGKYFFYPAFRMIPSTGSLLIIYGFSSSNDFPGLKVTEQASTDPANSLETPLIFKAGLGFVTLSFGCGGVAGLPPGVCRYGDYSAASVDLGTPNTVWVQGEIGAGIGTGMNAQWGTEIGSITG